MKQETKEADPDSLAGNRMPPPLPDPRRLARSARVARAWAVAGGVGFAALWVGKPWGGLLTGGTCGLHALTGLPCGLCGATRATRALFAGDWSRAWELNALAVPVVFLSGVAGVLVLCEVVTGRRWIPVWPLRLRVAVVLAACAGLLVWTAFQIRTALSENNRELVNFQHPVVKFLEGNGKGN